MAYSDPTTRTPQAPHGDPNMYRPHDDPALRSSRSGSSVFAGLGVAVVLIIGVIVGTSIIGGDPENADTTAPAATEQSMPASDAADAPVAPSANDGAAATQPAE